MNYLLKFIIVYIIICALYLSSKIQPIYLTFSLEKIECVLHSFGVEEYSKRVKMAHSIYYSCKQYKFDPYLIIALIYTESNFNPKAKSHKGYIGLMQTPKTTNYIETDIHYGCTILNEKLKITKGDLLKALTLYKGGNNEIAYKQATQVLYIYYQIKSVFK